MACSEGDTKSGKLLIRYTSADTGMRPINPCTDYWLSPDIWLEGGVDATTAKVGVQNTVKVRVKNISQILLEDINVQVWVCDYTLGVGPNSGRPSAGGATPLTGFVSQINPGLSAEIACSPLWTPETEDAALNNGHVCLAANCYADTPPDGATIPPDIFKFCCDSHHGQRNIGVVAVKSPSGDMSFRMNAANPEAGEGRRPELFTLQIEEVRGPAAFGPDEQDLIKSGPYAQLDVRPSDEKVLEYGVGGRGCLDLLGLGSKKENRILLPPGKSVPIMVRAKFSPTEKIGSLHTFEIRQVNSAGEVVGGARLLTVIT